jgi:hypothetical protein
LTTFTVGLSAKAEEGFGALFSDNEDGGSLADDVRATLGYKRTYFQSRNWAAMDKAIRKAETELQTACAKEKWAGTPGTTKAEAMAACTGQNLKDWALKEGKDTTFASADAQESLFEAVWGVAHPTWEWGFGAEAGYQVLTYRNLLSTNPAEEDLSDPFKRKEHKDTHRQWQLNGYIGLFPKLSDEPAVFLSVLTEVGERWEYPDETDAKTVCPTPAAGHPFTICSTKINTAAPVRDEFWRLGTQFRIALNGLPSIPTIGIAPKLTIDVTDGQFAYDIPITFIQTSGKLNAGIRFKGQRGGDNPDPFSVGLFLGTAFGVAE